MFSTTKVGCSVMRSFSPSDLTALTGQVLMESCWVYALLRVITALVPSELAPSWGGLLVLQLTAAVLARAAGGVSWHVLLQRAALAFLELLLLLVFLFFTLAPRASGLTLSAITEPWQHGARISGPLTFLVWCSASFLTARGALIGSRTAEAASVRRWFLIGAIALIVLYALLARGGVALTELPIAELQALTSVYFLGGCTVCALVERQTAHARYKLAARRSAAFGLALAAPLLALGLCSVALSSGARGTYALLEYVQLGVLRVLQLAWMLLQWLAHVFADLLRLIATSTSTTPPKNANNAWGLPDSPFGFGHWHAALTRTEWDALPAVLGLSALLVAALFLVFWLRARVRPQQPALQEQSSSLFSWKHVWRNWRAQLTAARSLLSRQRDAVAALVRAGRPPRDMRGLYRQLLRWAAAQGHTRRDGVTPLELVEELGRRWPDRRQELQVFTGYYNRVRYGAHAASETELAHARALLERLLREPTQP
jgi:hypothetical protein